MADISLTLDPSSVSEALDVRHASIRERLSEPFIASIWVVSRQHDLDLDAVIGNAATLRYFPQGGEGAATAFYLHGVCLDAEHLRSEATGLSAYALHLGPRLSLLDYRRNYRHFQQQSAVQIASSLLDEWHIPFELRVEVGAYPALDMRVQYGESDLAFFQRLLDCHGITYHFQSDEEGTKVVLDDRVHDRSPRERTVPFVDSPNLAGGSQALSSVRLRRNLRPGRYRIQAHDFRRPADFDFAGEATGRGESEARFERVHYIPGAFATAGHDGGDTPVADDRGRVRGSIDHGRRLAEIGLERHRSDQHVVDYVGNVFDLRAGAVFSLTGHPRPELGERPLLVRELCTELYVDTESSMAGTALFADRAYRPPIRHQPPRVHSLESATVVGPSGEEIHTDEFGRVRVRFHWDRRTGGDETSSCWVRVSYGWAGAGFGMVAVPRVGQEVVIGFLGGDPDQPVVIGRLYNGTNPVPHTLPESKTISTWKSSSTPNGEGFNEFHFDDRAGAELVYLRAERDREKLVRHDERENVRNNRTVEIGGDHEKTVKGNERLITERRRLTRVLAEELKQVQGEEHVRTENVSRRTVAGDAHDVTNGVRRDLVNNDAHLVVTGDLRERVSGKRSMTTDTLHMSVGSELAVESPSTFIVTNTAVIEARDGITFKVGGSFIKIAPDQVAISGAMIFLNSGGSPDTASAASPDQAEEAEEAVVEDSD